MTVLTAQIVLKTADALPANFVTNTLHFDSDDVAAAPARATAHIEAFYTSLRGIIPDTIAFSGHEVKWYVTDQPQPNFPYATESFDLGSAPTQPPLPSEVAICISYEAQKLNGTSQASRRGRIYFGPLATNALTDGRPSTALGIQIGTAFQTLIFDTKTDGDDLGVYSPKLKTFAEFNNGWVDNAFDTQRRRGLQPTSRVTWGLGDPPS